MQYNKSSRCIKMSKIFKVYIDDIFVFNFDFINEYEIIYLKCLNGDDYNVDFLIFLTIN